MHNSLSTPLAERPSPKLASYLGRERFKLVLDENRTVSLVPTGNLVVRTEVRDLRNRLHVDQLPTGRAANISCDRAFFHFHPCRER